MPEQRPRRKKGGGRGGGGNSKSGRQAEGEDEDCDDSPDSFSLSNSSTSEYNEEENNEEDEEEEEEEMQVGEVNDEDDDDVDKNGSRSSSRSRNRSSSFRNNNKPPGTVVAAASRSASGNLVSASAAASHEASNNKEKKRKRIRRKSRSNHSDDGTTGADKRRTEAGGYAHTVESRLAISRANRGNVPWNKGRKRSGTDVAKIRAGVQARNNLLAKQKREAYSLTLEEDQRLRRQIKYWREKVRRMKVDNDRRQQIKAENAREWATIETGLARLRQASRGARSSSLDSDASSEEEDDDDDNDDNCQDKAAGNGITEDGGDGQPEQGQQQEGRSPVRLLSDDPVVWAPVHELGEGRIVCPNHDHGSGGFACCQDCWDRSVRCLVETAKDLCVVLCWRAALTFTAVPFCSSSQRHFLFFFFFFSLSLLRLTLVRVSGR
jgi:hypothetical protein